MRGIPKYPSAKAPTRVEMTTIGTAFDVGSVHTVVGEPVLGVTVGVLEGDDDGFAVAFLLGDLLGALLGDLLGAELVGARDGEVVGESDWA
jgi:hypothetical protein